MHKTFFRNNFTTGGKWIITFFITYLIYSYLTVIFSKLIGLSLDVAQSKDREYFQEFLIHLLIITVSVILMYFIYSYFEARYLENVYTSTRTKLFNGIMNKPMSQYIEEGDAALSSNLINDIRVLEDNYIKPYIEVSKEIILLIISLITLLQINIWTTLFIGCVSFVPILLPNLFMKKLNHKMNSYGNELQQYTLKINDYLAGYEFFKYNNVELKVFEKHGVYNKELARQKRKAFLYLDFVSNSVAVSSILITIGVLLVGMFLAIHGQLTIGEVFAISFISNGVSGPLGNISNYLPKIQGSDAFLMKYNGFLITPNNKEPISPMEQNIRLDHVSLSFDKPVLNNVSLELDKNKKYTIIGESGSGKSTLFKLILGYYENYTGEILVDNQSIKNKDMNSIYNFIACVSQNTYLFQGSIKDNLTMFRQSIEDDTINKVLEMVEMKEKIAALEHGLKTVIEEGGKNFSGGEKQRISIARALLNNKDVLFLDEATSALDEENYLKIEQNLILLSNITIISITHRIAKEVLLGYDEIIVMKNGMVEEKGNFKELIDKKGYFYQLYSNQEQKA